MTEKRWAIRIGRANSKRDVPYFMGDDYGIVRLFLDRNDAKRACTESCHHPVRVNVPEIRRKR